MIAARPRRRLLVATRRLYGLALVVAVAWVLATSGADVVAVVRTGRPLLLLACLLASFGQLALTSALWRSGLRALGSPVPWATSLHATASAAPARYLPGSIWYAVSRGAALQRTGVPARVLVAVATLEMLLVPVVGFAAGTALLSASGARIGAVPPPLLLLAAAVLLLLASPPVVNTALRLRAGDGVPPRIGWGGLCRLIAWTAAFWVWAAGVFALYVAAFPGASESGPATVAGAYMIAWGVGWLAVFAPQGVGVFEVTLSALVAGGGSGLVIVLAGYRAVVLVRDLAAAGLAALSGPRRRAPAASRHEV